MHALAYATFVHSQNPKTLRSPSVSGHEGPPNAVLLWLRLHSAAPPFALRRQFQQLTLSGSRQTPRKPYTHHYYSATAVDGASSR